MNLLIVPCNFSVKTIEIFSESKRERYVLSEYRRLFSAERKVKRAELWARVEMSEEPISKKMFDEILRRFCFSQGQHWALKPKLT